MSLSPPTTALALRPGVPVVRRDAGTIQVGLQPPLAVRLPDVPDVRTLLKDLRGGAVTGDLTPVAAAALDRLVAAGLAVSAIADPELVEDLVAQAQFGADGPRRLADRAAHPIGVRADGVSRPVLADLLATAGLVVDDTAAAVWLVVTPGPVTRESVDPLMRAGMPHLLVTGDTIGGRRVGPFVEPGRTACLRCVDAYDAEADPRQPFLVEQAALASDGTEPIDPVLDRIALAWAVRDLCRYLEGDEPSTWSATVDLGPANAPEVVRWLRHPHCGCAWDLLFDLP